MTRTELTSGVYGNPNPHPVVQTGIKNPNNSNQISSIIPSSGWYGTSWPAYSGSVIPQGLGGGGWTLDATTPKTYDRGYPQQTFLGASIRSFSMNGGFGDSSSSLSVELVVDEYNDSDKTSQGRGDDVYHSGLGDRFVPPMAGSPVFFKFGTNFATVEEAYRYTFDTIYKTNTLQPSVVNSAGRFNKDNFTSLGENQYVNLENNTIYNFNQASTGAGRGSGHIVFGGILQSYIQNRGPGGNPLYSVQVTDPREILSNVTVLLNNYAGSTFNTKNIFNVYGFLEHNFSITLSGQLMGYFGGFNLLKKFVNPTNGYVTYSGEMSRTDPVDCWVGGGQFPAFGASKPFFPYTGTGMSRRGPQGIPYYRLVQGMNALMSTQYALPGEYINKGYGGVINFRGYNYVVDFSGLPTLPPMYFLDFDQINLLDLALEVCDVASRDLFVSLLPVINHPACQFIHRNQQGPTAGTNPIPSGLIAGIIRLDSIDRSSPPRYGAIKRYIDSLSNRGINVENQDVGYELSNVTTDKFVVGAQEVDMYCFSTNNDRGMVNARNRRSGGESNDADWQQWTFEKQIEQQVLPYYGTLGQGAVTIPKGWGSYQQVLLDTTGLNAKGVGAYYVATEMELRCASVSYECWKNFLQQYNDTYLESIEDNDTYEGAALTQTANFGGVPPRPIATNYAVTVPRSVFDTYVASGVRFGSDNLPSSPCNPPYGYPLYYKRMTKLGIPEGGLTRLQSRITGFITGSAAIRGADADSWDDIRNSQLAELEQINYGELSQEEKTYYDAIKARLNENPPNLDLLNDVEDGLHRIGAVLPRLAKKGTENALKVYEFLKKIADENLGKKFLVKIPSKVNLFYEDIITWKDGEQGGEYFTGPFGFKPRPVTSGINEEFSAAFKSRVVRDRPRDTNSIVSFLSSETDPKQNNYVGALKVNFNPIADKYEFNYSPTNLGGYFPFDLYTNTLSFNQIRSLPDAVKPKGVYQLLIPQDSTNFIDENGRLSAYVRFDHSQHLALNSMNSEDFTQQLITSRGMVPDLCEFLENTGEDRWESFNDADADRRDNDPAAKKQCLFVKCTVDEKFYMAPKLITREIQVFGANPTPRPKLSRPRKIFISCSGWKEGSSRTSSADLIPGTGCYIDSFRFIEYNFIPTTGTGSSARRLDYDRPFSTELNSHIVNTTLQNLDTRFVYALITLPNKIAPTKDSRFRDSINQQGDTKSIKHYLTIDVIKRLPEFNDVAYANEASQTNPTNLPAFSAETRSRAWLAAKKAKYAMQFGFPYQMQMAAPSPVYPDLVVLPLMSHERCYGPWISSQVDPQSNAYINVGGRVEFIKDENLAPWNYAGYELMNDAGVLQAQFSNSLLLFSERGGFTFPGIPDRSLCQTLEDGGPLVTNISVDVSEAGLRTTYKLDLYTASFGKLQKQKQDMISKISRERQRLRDERNALIRKGIGKAQSSVNTIGAINLFGNNGTPVNVPQMNNYIVASVNEYESQAYSPVLAGGNFGSNFGDAPANQSVGVVDHGFAVGNTSEESVIDSINFFAGEKGNLLYNNRSFRTGGASYDQIWSPYSQEYNPNMPNTLNINKQARQQFYDTQ
jgi:hypothetical protein